MNPAFLSLDGKLHKTGEPLISPDNRSFRYGDGFFETMKLVNGKIALEELHFERLFASLALLQFEAPKWFTANYLRDQIIELAEKNNCTQLARIRLTIFRGDGGLYDQVSHFPHHLIQAWQLSPQVNTLNENGLIIDIYRDARKSCDGFSHVKSNNYLPYTMAALWVKQEKLNEALLLNAQDRVADATIANVFIVKDGVIKTPSLQEGCVAGVMRRYLLQCFRENNIETDESGVTLADLQQASEIFLTNSIQGIKWVKQWGSHHYGNTVACQLFKRFIEPLSLH